MNSTSMESQPQRSWECRQDFLDLLAAQCGGLLARAENGKTRHGVGDNLRVSGMFPAWTEHNPSINDVRVQRVSLSDAEPAAQRTWKDDLAFGGNFSLHSKTILP